MDQYDKNQARDGEFLGVPYHECEIPGFGLTDLKTGDWWADGHFFGVLEVKGSDAGSYLHGQTSNDVNSLKVGEGQPSTLNTHCTALRKRLPAPLTMYNSN